MERPLFPEIVQREIKRRVTAATKIERKWMLEAMSLEELMNEVSERATMHKAGEAAMVDIAKKIVWRDNALAEGSDKWVTTT